MFVRQSTLSARIAGKQRERLLPVPRLQWLAIVVAFFGGVAGFCGEVLSGGVDVQTQEKVAQLLQKVIQDYWNGDAKDAAETNRAGSSTKVEAAFRQASKLMPERVDLRFGIASALMSQAVQTNGVELRLKVNQALRVYQHISALDTNEFEAPILYAAYTRAIGETNESQGTIKALLAMNPPRTEEYLEKFTRVDRILQTTPNEIPSRTMPKHNHYAIVVLGAGLETNGAIKAKLTSRLQQGLKLARMYRSAPVILTGGNQKSGVTEAYMMSQWFTQKGISRQRLILEDKARDTVENALFSTAILQRLGVTHVTLVTSCSHIRRGLADLEEACFQRGLKLEFDQLGAKAKGDKNLDPQQERLGVYRDLMRTSGLWAFPGLQR
jgi:uncharacterized SAM-binding protein YcdF (DUF218 family)